MSKILFNSFINEGTIEMLQLVQRRVPRTTPTQRE